MGILNEGMKKDEGKLRVDLIPVEVIESLAAVLGMGAEKYEERNFEKGINYSKIYAATLRHLLAWWGGEDIDPESGFDHTDHILCNAAILCTYVHRRMGNFDDRPNPKSLYGPAIVLDEEKSDPIIVGHSAPLREDPLKGKSVDEICDGCIRPYCESCVVYNYDKEKKVHMNTADVKRKKIGITVNG